MGEELWCIYREYGYNLSKLPKPYEKGYHITPKTMILLSVAIVLIVPEVSSIQYNLTYSTCLLFSI